MSTLSQKAVLAALNITQWTARRLDKEITEETNERHGATQDAGRYNKLLFDKSAIQPLQTIAGRARALHLKKTQPWQDQGPRVLPSALCLEYMNEMRTLRGEFDHLADDFALHYPEYVEQRRKKLNGMFRESDYPAARHIRKRFGFTVEMFNIPDADDFRLDISSEYVDDLRATIEDSTKRAVQTAMDDAAQRIVETVGHMATKLRAYKAGTDDDKAEGVFRDSLVENVRELARLLPAFNLTDDKKLAAITKRIETDLCAHDADTLRDSETTRDDVAKSAEAILADATAYLA